jgi:hypothetical protein
MDHLVEKVAARYMESARRPTQEQLDWWWSELEQVSEVDMDDPKGGVEMYAWDAGWEGDRPAKWLIDYGKYLGVDVMREWRKGQKARKEDG